MCRIDTMKPEECAPTEWLGSMEPCAYCQTDLTHQPTFGDCFLRRGVFEWGLVCPACIEARGLHIEYGQGQLYQNRPGKRPICIAGEP